MLKSEYLEGAGLPGIRKQGQEPGFIDQLLDPSLVLGAITGKTAGIDFALFRHKNF